MKSLTRPLDELHQQGKLEWTNKATPYSYPCFVVWKNTPLGQKGRVVVDLQGLNAITEDNVYPLPLQTYIIERVANYRYISTVDAHSYFHQFQIAEYDKHKFTIISHQGQETSNVALMGYKGSPPYVQQVTDRIL